MPIGDLTIHDVSFTETVDRIVRWAAERSGGYVCTPNVDYVVRSRRDAEFRQAIQAARLRVPDGMWMVYASRLAGRGLRGTVTGRLLLPSVAEIAIREGLCLGLFGAATGVADQVRGVLERTHSGIRVVAAITPPTPFEVGGPADQRAVAELKRASPDIIFVALGAPKQEIWMQRHQADLEGAVSVGVGAAFDIVAGRFREAPRWMTRHGFEWLFRLVQEPRRLARRYLLDDPWILYWALKMRLARHEGNADQPPDAAS